METGLQSLLGVEDILKGEGNKIPLAEAVKGMDLICLYFSAHWCGPCRNFTPKLAEAYKKWQSEGKKIEIIFGSSDTDVKAWGEYYKEMPWLSFPFGDKRKVNLSAQYQVNGIPWLVVLDKSGKLIKNEADTDISSSGANAIDGWLKSLG